MKHLPERATLIAILDNINDDIESRENAANWAASIINDDDVELNDLNVWRVLKKIGAVDLPAAEGGYLFNSEDFISWKNELI